MQDIEVFGVDPASRVAGVLVEADYHMKLIGMGLADGVDGVESYLDSVGEAASAAGNSAPPMSVLRWWFALNYDSIRTTPDGDAFELVGQGVRVLSENELLGRARASACTPAKASRSIASLPRILPRTLPSWPQSIRCTVNCGICSIWQWPWR